MKKKLNKNKSEAKTGIYLSVSFVFDFKAFLPPIRRILETVKKAAAIAIAKEFINGIF